MLAIIINTLIIVSIIVLLLLLCLYSNIFLIMKHTIIRQTVKNGQSFSVIKNDTVL